MFITTVTNPNQQIVGRAIAASEYLNCTYVERRNHTLIQIQKQRDDFELLVFYDSECRYLRVNQPDLFFHPSMGHVRVKRMLNGEMDRMVSISEIVEGDVVLDCTAGLCSDSLVFAKAVGDSGQVIAVESNPVLYFVLRDGIAHYHGEVNDINESLKRIKLIHSDHLQVLKQCESDSIDVVYFDPMFDEPMHDSQSMLPLRGLANERPLDLETIEQAIRVARRKVVMKNNKGSRAFEHLGFQEVVHGGTNIAYGVINK